MTAGRAGDAGDIKALLKRNAERLAAELLPDGHRNGNYWIACNPSRADRHAGSFWVWISGERAGAFCDAAADQKGDVFGLVQLVLGCDFKEALAWSRSWLGLSNAPRREIARAAQAARPTEADAAAQRAARERQMASVVRTFRAAKARPFAGSPADRYLRSRGIDLKALGKQPGVLGWLPDALHSETQTRWPVMVLGIQRPGGSEIVALHKTFLEPDGSGKAPLESERTVWPAGWLGGVVRAWRGGSGMREDEAAACGLRESLVLGEGFETVMSAVMAEPERRAWATVTLGNLAHVALPECCDEAIVCVDNDWGKPQAARSLHRGLSALVAQGRTVSTMRSPMGKDFNDALRGTR